MLGGMELVILVVVIGVLIFGAAKIPQLAKTFGKAKSEYKKGEIEGDKELKDFKENNKGETYYRVILIIRAPSREKIMFDIKLI